MRAVRPDPMRADSARRWPPAAWAVGLLIFSAIFLASDIAIHPIVLWDESRLAVNALEMSRTGFSLVTTFGFKPDLWNTKPPLLIWLMSACIRLFGPAEWVIRLPSLIAAFATVVLVMVFSWRLGRSLFVAMCAPFLLLMSPGFFGTHAAKAGDYDALLCLFTTAYVFLLFDTLRRARPSAGRIILCGLLVAGACLTKGVAGLVPGAGILTYVLARRRWPRLFQTPWYLVSGLICVALVGGFYVLRERASPGYLEAVKFNELTGRYLQGMNSHVHPIYYYLEVIFDQFALGPAPLLLFVAALWRWPKGKSAAFFNYGFHVSLGILVVFSLSQTKIFWYMTPIYPFLSIMLAILGERLLAKPPVRPRQSVRTAHLVVALGAVLLVFLAVYGKFVVAPQQENIPQARYGLVFAQLSQSGHRHVLAVDGGVNNDSELVDYTPQRDFYTLVWRARGLDIQEGDDVGAAPATAGEVVMTCDERYLASVNALGPPLTTVEGCAAASPRG